jgi:uncharacterized protein
MRSLDAGGRLNELEFEWESEKAAGNRQKHGVTFEEASSAFDDPNRRLEYDERHTFREDRWLLLGISVRGRLLVVIYTKRNETIRIISARRANQTETRRYAGQD